MKMLELVKYEKSMDISAPMVGLSTNFNRAEIGRDMIGRFPADPSPLHPIHLLTTSVCGDVSRIQTKGTANFMTC
jgi:hypothetical protein